MVAGLTLTLIGRGLAGAFGVAVAWGVLAVHRATHLPRYRLDLTPADLHLPFESFTVTTPDGLRLGGWLVLPSSPRGVVLVQHGYGTCRADPLQFLALVVRGGYAVVSVDFRGHGESGGTCSFGRWEPQDIRVVVDAIAADPRLQRLPVAYLGISMGAAIGILSAAEDPRIRAVVSDSSYARVQPLVGRYQRMAYGVPEIPFGWITAVCLAVALRTPLSRLDPVRAIRRLRCPVLIIHGMEDQNISVDYAQDLYAAAQEPKELWMVPGAGHVANLCTAETEYTQRVLGFLARSLS